MGAADCLLSVHTAVQGRCIQKQGRTQSKQALAYRQFTRWCWGILGKEIRVVLPSRVVMCIRAHFPPPGYEDDFVFEGFKYADE